MPVYNLPARKLELSPANEGSPTVSKTITYANVEKLHSALRAGGQANRKACSWSGGVEIREKANAVL